MPTFDDFIAVAGRALGVVLCVDADKNLTCFEQPFFNRVSAVRGSDGRMYVARVARSNLLRAADPKITNDYTNIGFFEKGGAYRLRSPVEQASFHCECLARGLAVPAIAFTNELGCLMELVAGPTLASVLQSTIGDDVIIRYLESLFAAHTLDVLFGDRHSCNTIVMESRAMCHIDFDIHIEGPVAREFEISEAIFRAFHMAAHNPYAVDAGAAFLIAHADFYSRRDVIFFLRRTCEYKGTYPSGKYAEVVPLVDRLVRRLESDS